MWDEEYENLTDTLVTNSLALTLNIVALKDKNQLITKEDKKDQKELSRLLLATTCSTLKLNKKIGDTSFMQADRTNYINFLNQALQFTNQKTK